MFDDDDDDGDFSTSAGFSLLFCEVRTFSKKKLACEKIFGGF
jgi:hypothetical protein